MSTTQGYTRITVPNRPDLNNVPAIISIGGVVLEDRLQMTQGASGGTEASRAKGSADKLGYYRDYDDIPIVTAEEGKAVGIRGGVIDKDGYAYSEPIRMMTGDIYRINVGTLDEDVCIIARCTMSKNRIEPVYTMAKSQSTTPTRKNWIECTITEANGTVHTYVRANSSSRTYYEVIDGEEVLIGDELPTYYHYSTVQFQKLVILNPEAEVPADGYVCYIPDEDMDVVVSYHLETYVPSIIRARVGVVSNLITKIDRLNKAHESDASAMDSIESIIGLLNEDKLVVVNRDGSIAIEDNYSTNGEKFLEDHPDAVKVISAGTVQDTDGNTLFGRNGVLERATVRVGDGCTDISYAFEGCTALKKAVISGGNSVTDAEGMFYGCTSLESVNMDGFYHGGIETIESMFYGCESLRSLRLLCIDWSSVTSMASMFGGCSSLSDIEFDYDTVDTSHIEDFSFAFQGCSSMELIDDGMYIDMSSATTAESMFDGCANINDRFFYHDDMLVLEATSGTLTNMRGMFRGCASLDAPDLSGINTSAVTDFTNVFRDCGARVLDLSSWDFTSHISASGLLNSFKGCSRLETLDISGMSSGDFTYATVAGMFDGCTSLENLTIGLEDTLHCQLYLGHSPLSADSVEEVITWISYTGGGSAPTLTLSRTAVDNYDAVNNDGTCAMDVAAKGFMLDINEDY